VTFNVSDFERLERSMGIGHKAHPTQFS